MCLAMIMIHKYLFILIKTTTRPVDIILLCYQHSYLFDYVINAGMSLGGRAPSNLMPLQVIRVIRVT